jgi:hypothetical protein
VQQWHQAWCRALRTEQQEDCAALARPTPSLNARLAQACLVEHGQQMLLGMHLCNYFEQACDSRLGGGPRWSMQVCKWSQVFAQISVGCRLEGGPALVFSA